MSISREEDTSGGSADRRCIDQVLGKLSRLPPPQHPHILTNEQELIRQRIRNAVQYIETGGGYAADEERTESTEDLTQRLQQSLAVEYENYTSTRDTEAP